MKLKAKLISFLEKTTGLKDLDLEFPENRAFGDFSSNVAMVLGKKEGKNPKELAGEIKKKLENEPEIKETVEKIEIAGPGFINFFLGEKTLARELEEINNKKETYGTSDLGKGKTVVIDYSSPNIAKRFGIGHVRSTIIGQAFYNLYKFLGYKVIGDNHLGDWGTQFGTLLYQIDSKGLDPEKLTIDELETFYVEFNSEAEKDEKLWGFARGWFKKLEEKDPKAREIWEKIVETSNAEFERIYELL